MHDIHFTKVSLLHKIKSSAILWCLHKAAEH